MSEKKLRAALKALLNHYVDLVKSGDAGIWNVEAEPVVKRARAALATPASAPVGETTDNAIMWAIEAAVGSCARQMLLGDGPSRWVIDYAKIVREAKSRTAARAAERRDQEEGR